MDVKEFVTAIFEKPYLEYLSTEYKIIKALTTLIATIALFPNL
jgi:hypothetical protein